MPAKSDFDKDIKGVPQMSAATTLGGIKRALTLSSASSETGVNSARANTKGYQ